MEDPIPKSKKSCLTKPIYQRRQFGNKGFEISLPSELTGIIYELDIYKDIEMNGYFNFLRKDGTYPLGVWELLQTKFKQFIVNTKSSWFQISFQCLSREIDIYFFNDGKIHINGLFYYDDFIRIRFYFWRLISLFIMEIEEDPKNWKTSNIYISSCSIKLSPFPYQFYAQYTREPLKLVYKMLSDVPINIIEHINNLHDFELNEKDALVIDVQMEIPENDARIDYDCYAVVSGGLIEFSDKDFIQPGMKNAIANLVTKTIHNSPINVITK